MPQRRRSWTQPATLVLAVTFAAMSSGAAQAATMTPPAPITALAPRAAATSATAASSLPAATSRAKLRASYRSLRSSLSGRTGIAVTPAGRGAKGRATIELGSWRTGYAWSTSKVPVAIASLREKNSSRNRYLTRKAITRSDNAAAATQRRSLGSPKKGARKVSRVLRDYRDTTSVPALAGFGKMRWSLARSSKFTGSLANTREKEARYVLRAMGDVTKSQRWGLGTIKGASFKGGWAPMQGGGYLVRQMGVIRAKDGRCWGVSIASQHGRGFNAAKKDMNRMARWLTKNIAKFPAGTCPRLP